MRTKWRVQLVFGAVALLTSLRIAMPNEMCLAVTWSPKETRQITSRAKVRMRAVIVRMNKRMVHVSDVGELPTMPTLAMQQLIFMVIDCDTLVFMVVVFSSVQEIEMLDSTVER